MNQSGTTQLPFLIENFFAFFLHVSILDRIELQLLAILLSISDNS